MLTSRSGVDEAAVEPGGVLYRMVVLAIMAPLLGSIVALLAIGFVDSIGCLNKRLLVSPHARAQVVDTRWLSFPTVLVPTLGGLLVGLLIQHGSRVGDRSDHPTSSLPCNCIVPCRRRAQESSRALLRHCRLAVVPRSANTDRWCTSGGVRSVSHEPEAGYSELAGGRHCLRSGGRYFDRVKCADRRARLCPRGHTPSLLVTGLRTNHRGGRNRLRRRESGIRTRATFSG